MASKINKGEILAKFFDDGEYTALFADGAVSAACGYAAGQQAYAVYQNGEAVTVKDVEKNIKVLEMAAQTGCPVVTFYNSVGAKLAEGLDVLTANAKLNAQIAKVSGVIPQVAVVLGVCGGTSALSAANADVCIMAEGAELFFTAPFTSAAKGDKVADAGTAAAAAKAGVAAIVAPTAEEAAEKAAHIVGLLPANNLTGPAIFEFEQPTAALAAGAEPAKAAAAVVDKDSTVELYAGFGKSVYTAFATVGGNAVGVVATGKNLCHNCVAKIARFVRLCDAFSVPVVTVVDTEGFVPSVSDDIAGGIREAARLAATYADATTAKVTVLAGKAVGPSTPHWLLRTCALPSLAAWSALWSPAQRSAFCTRMRSTLPTTSLLPPTPRLPLTPQRCAALPTLWPAVLPIWSVTLPMCAPAWWQPWSC